MHCARSSGDPNTSAGLPSAYVRPLLSTRMRSARLARSSNEKEYNYPMDKREFLDRLDECVMTLFLDENHTWVSSVIQILSWRVVLSNVEVE